MKKTLLALCAFAAVSAFAFDTASSSLNVNTASQAAATASGNGNAFTATRGAQLANSGSVAYTDGQGVAGVTGFASTAGFAESFTKTSGNAAAGSGTRGTASADASAAAIFNSNAGYGIANGVASSDNLNFAATGSTGKGEAYRGNETSAFGGFASLATVAGNEVHSSVTAQADATRDVFKATTKGTAGGLENVVNVGNAGGLANAVK